jgi:hypothetical protein
MEVSRYSNTSFMTHTAGHAFDMAHIHRNVTHAQTDTHTPCLAEHAAPLLAAQIAHAPVHMSKNMRSLNDLRGCMCVSVCGFCVCMCVCVCCVCACACVCMCVHACAWVQVQVCVCDACAHVYVFVRACCFPDSVCHSVHYFPTQPSCKLGSTDSTALLAESATSLWALPAAFANSSKQAPFAQRT